MSGYKTYIAAALMALGSIGGWLADQIDTPTMVEGLLTAAAVAGIRHGIEKKQ